MAKRTAVKAPDCYGVAMARNPRFVVAWFSTRERAEAARPDTADTPAARRTVIVEGDRLHGDTFVRGY